MRNDIRIKRLFAKFGIEGYGLYNLILESISEGITTDSPLPELQATCEDIAAFYNGNPETINEMVSFMIDQKLIEWNEKKKQFLCPKIYKYFEQSQTKSQEIRALIAQYRKVSELP